MFSAIVQFITTKMASNEPEQATVLATDPRSSSSPTSTKQPKSRSKSKENPKTVPASGNGKSLEFHLHPEPNENTRLDSKSKNPWLFIPIVFADERGPSSLKNWIFLIFKKLKIGFVEEVKLIERKSKGEKVCYSVIIRFKNWFTNEQAKSVLSKISDGDSFKLFYSESEKSFWKVFKYVDRSSARPSVRLDLN